MKKLIAILLMTCSSAALAALTLEGTPVHVSGVLTIGPFTTSNPALVVIVSMQNGSGVDSQISSITGGGLTFARRAIGGAANGRIEIWTANASASFSGVTFTIVYSPQPYTFNSIDLFAISGQDTSTIYDGNGSIPANSVSDPITVSTTNANDFIIGAFRMATIATPTQGTGWTKISGADYLLTEYKIVSATQSNLSVSVGTGVGDANGGIADAVMQASAVVPIGFGKISENQEGYIPITEPVNDATYLLSANGR